MKNEYPQEPGRGLSAPDAPPPISAEFVGETVPPALTPLTRTLFELIDHELSDEGSKISFENREVLQDLRTEISDTKFSSVIDRQNPVVITPQEIVWLERHPRDQWLTYLTHRYKFKVYPIKKILSTFPRHLLIEPTSICNIRCTMCFQVDKSFTSNREMMGMMDLGFFTSLVDQAADNECLAITLASRGEPTLHKRFGDMLAYLKEKNILDTKINTNATRLTEKMAHDILKADVSTVTFSVDASTKETYERIRVGGDFDHVLSNIDRFKEIRETHYPDSGTTTRISGVAVEGTQDPVEMRRFWSNYVDHVTIVPMHPRWDTYGNNPFVRQTVCSLLYERMYVWFDGRCNPCDFDYKSLLSVGNAHEQSLSSIWNGGKYQELRDQHEARMRASVVPCDRCPK